MQTIIACVITAVVALAIGIPAGIQWRKNVAEKEISSAEEEAKRIINEAIKGAEAKSARPLVEAKEEILQARNEYEREVKGAPCRPVEAGAPAPAEGREPGPQDRKYGEEGKTFRNKLTELENAGKRWLWSKRPRWKFWSGSPALPRRRPRLTSSIRSKMM